MSSKIAIKTVNRFRWKYFFLVCLPSIITGLIKILTEGYEPIVLIFLIPVLLGILIGFIMGRNNVEYFVNGKWKRIG